MSGKWREPTARENQWDSLTSFTAVGNAINCMFNRPIENIWNMPVQVLLRTSRNAYRVYVILIKKKKLNCSSFWHQNYHTDCKLLYWITNVLFLSFPYKVIKCINFHIHKHTCNVETEIAIISTRIVQERLATYYIVWRAHTHIQKINTMFLPHENFVINIKMFIVEQNGSAIEPSNSC